MAARDDATDFGAFLRAFGVRWFVFMSGPLTVPFTLVALFIENTWLKTLSGLLAATCAVFASYWVWRHERQQVIGLARRVKELETRLEPALMFVRQDCCRRNPSLGQVGVANPHPITVEDARVYITVPALQIDDVLLKWAGMDADEGLDIHQAPLPHHHHTSYFVSVGDRPGQYFFHPAYGAALPIEAGQYMAELCVKGRNVTAATARIEFILANRSLTLSLP